VASPNRPGSSDHRGSAKSGDPEDDPLPPDATTLHLRRARDGADESLAWLVARFSPLLRAQAAYRLPGSLSRLIDPDDLVDEVWLVALPRLGDLRERDGHGAPVLLKFLSATLLNKVNNLITKHLRGPRGGRVSNPEGQAASEPLDRYPAQLTSALTLAQRDERRDALRRALDELPPQDREILVLRGIEQVSNREVGRQLGLEPSAVTMRYRRALERLRDQLPGSLLDELAAD